MEKVKYLVDIEPLLLITNSMSSYQIWMEYEKHIHKAFLLIWDNKGIGMEVLGHIISSLVIIFRAK